MNRPGTAGGLIATTSRASGLARLGRNLILTSWVAVGVWPSASVSGAEVPGNEILIVGLRGTVQVRTAGSAQWIFTTTNQVLKPLDRLRSGPDSHVTLRWSDQSVVPFGPLTEIEILEPHAPGALRGLHLLKGIASFFHRDQPGRIRVITRGAVAGVDGTEFVVEVKEVEGAERTTLSVVDGVVRLTNELDGLILTNGQQAVATPGQPPVRTPGFVVNDVLQWCFYYPGVLDVVDLSLTAEERASLSASLAAYQAGDLLAALASYPSNRLPASEAERVFRAALWLAVGQVEKTEAELSALGTGRASAVPQRLAGSLRQVIAVVKRQPTAGTNAPQLATELLAASYVAQARGLGEASLVTALNLAQQATAVSPQFGFAWVRVAELEFSFGHLGTAEEAVDRALTLSPRNAQALALKGFFAAARNQTHPALVWFNRALAVDSGLGNAWLGRGLTRIRRGDLAGGREDLVVAAAREPQRGFLRSYLGKAYADSGDGRRARHELDLAKRLDSADPTAWLYSALLLQQQNRINEAVGELEGSQERNENRQVYRSQFMLDQDRSTRSANLAGVYQDAGMIEWARLEAGRAVASDYANWSAHLFLANSYDQLRDPNRINLRYETPAENEYLIANMLAPVGAGLLAQSVSQQEYSKLFERDRLGFASSTEYLSRGAWREQAAQFGTFQNSSYMLEALYRHDPGQRANNEFEELELRLHLKQQITTQDTLYFRAIYYQAEGGDLFQYYDPARSYDEGGPNRELRFQEEQKPDLAFGLHHEWGPGLHTLLLGGTFDDRYEVSDPVAYILLRGENNGELGGVRPLNIHQKAQTSVQIYTAEGQQIWQTPGHNTTMGGRFQWGEFDVHNFHYQPWDLDSLFPDPPIPQNVTPGFERWSVYGYHSWQIADPLLLVAGLSYDAITYPENFRSGPMSEGERHEEKLLPKGGMVWTPGGRTTVRAAYTQSLSPASLEGVGLEPTQVAGFNQAYRSIMPESVAGANAGALFETVDLSVEKALKTRTYLGLSGQLLYSTVHRTDGAYTLDPSINNKVFPSSILENLDYRERSVTFSVDQLLGDEWALGGRYRLTEGKLDDDFPEVTATTTVTAPFVASQRLEALLHQIELHTIYQHPSGLFGQVQAIWSLQHSSGYSPALADEDFWQFNVYAGYRFARRRVEVVLGVLNLTDRNYQLNPLTLYNELPRERTFLARLRFAF